jgi:hypothetical protein
MGRARVWYNLAMARETTLAEIRQMLTHVVEHMATKDDIASVPEELSDVRANISAMRANGLEGCRA